MKRLLANGVVAVLAAAMMGGASSFAGDGDAMLRGGILGVCIVAACWLINYFIGKFDVKRHQLLLAGVVGALLGLLGGFAIMSFNLNHSTAHGGLAQLGLSVLWACAGYGAAVNMTFRWGYGKDYGWFAITAMVYLSMVAIHLLLRLELFLFMEPLLVVGGAFGNCALFAISMGCLMCGLLSVGKMGKGGLVQYLLIATLFLAFPGFFCLLGFSINYPEARYRFENYHPEILSGLSGRIYFGLEECYVLGRGKEKPPVSGGRRCYFDIGGKVIAVGYGRNVGLYSLDNGFLLSTHEFKSVDAFAISPDGGKLAVNANDDDLSVIDISARGGVVRLPGRAWRMKEGLCWTRDSRSLVTCGIDGWLVEVPVSGGSARRLVKGRMPRLVEQTGEIVFVRGEEFCCLDLRSLAVRRLGVSTAAIDEGHLGWNYLYDVSPCGKFLVFKRWGMNMYSTAMWLVMVAEAKSGGKMHLLDSTDDSSFSLKWTK